MLRDTGDDSGARERIRARLRTAIEDAGRADRPRLPRNALIAAVLVALLATSLVVVNTFRGASSAAASEFRRLSSIAARAEDPANSHGLVRTTREEVVRETRTDLATGTTFDLVIHQLTQTSIAPDGSGDRRTEILDVDFASQADRDAWEASGEPPIPSRGELREQSFAPGQASRFDLQGLPSDPDALEDVLDARQLTPWPPGDAQTLDLIGELLGQGDASPAQRAALLEVAARLPGIQLETPAADPLERSGEALSLQGEGIRTRLVFDPRTAALLAVERYEEGADGGTVLETWAAFG